MRHERRSTEATKSFSKEDFALVSLTVIGGKMHAALTVVTDSMGHGDVRNP